MNPEGVPCSAECATVIPRRVRFVPIAGSGGDRYLTTLIVDQDALRAHLLAEHRSGGPWPRRRLAVA